MAKSLADLQREYLLTVAPASTQTRSIADLIWQTRNAGTNLGAKV